MKQYAGSDNNKVYFGYMDKQIQKILPLKESNNETTNIYIDSLMSELNGWYNHCFIYQGEEYKALFFSLLATLESLKIISDFTHYRREVFKCKNICQQLAKI